MLRTLPHLLACAFGPPLLIEPSRLDALLVGLAAAMLHRGPSELFELPDMHGETRPSESAPPAEERPRGYRIERGVATLPIHGVLMRRAGQISPESTPLQSYENLARVLRSAQRDNRVRGILLDVDSPGGEAGGVFDLANEIRASGRKPVWAMVNDDALSAAYVLASASDRVWATQTAALGSLGVVALHADQSAFDDKQGLKYTYLYRGARKIDAHPHGPLSNEAHHVIQAEVDRLYDKLVVVVAEQRRTEATTIRGTEAAVYYGEKAVERGLADRIGTIDEAHAALVEHTLQRGVRMDTTTPTAAPPAPPPTETPPAIPDNVVQLRVNEAVAAAQAQAGEIGELCNLAGYPALTAGFLAERLAPAAVRERLLARKAADSATRSVIALDTTSAPKGGSLPTAAELERAAQARFRAQNPR